MRAIAAFEPAPLDAYRPQELRHQAAAVLDGGGDVSAFVTAVLESVCGFSSATGTWQRGSGVGAEWSRAAVTGETVKPRHLWQGVGGGHLPVFLDREKRLGIGRGRKVTSQVLQWLRGGREQLALLTNGRQWRLMFAGLDFDAWCEWDLELWFEEGGLSPQVAALRTLIAPVLWTPGDKDTPAPLLQAILDSRKGQAELSKVLGERVREAVEILVQGHGEALKERCTGVDPADIYRAAARVVMRLVVVLFAESRDLLPRDHALYHSGYGLNGLLEELGKVAGRGGNRLARSWSAWPRLLALFHLVHDGSHHPELLVPAYGGELFALGDPGSPDGVARALAVFESACFDHEVLADRDVHRMLERITRTRVKVRQGRASTWVPAPVDFSDLSSEYIGILYEGLLDFELKTAPAGDPVIFLAVGNQPALPLSRLEAMDDKALKELFETLKDTSSGSGEEKAEAEEVLESDDAEAEADEGSDDDDDAEEEEPEAAQDEDEDDERHATRSRAEAWARRAVDVGKLVRKLKGKATPEKRLRHGEAVARKARQLVSKVILPGEWYLVRWGGTRKGAGTFYTRPGLAVPTVQRTLRPLAYDPPAGKDGTPDRDAPATSWTPKRPEEILALKVCDPACGSGSFPVAALRFLTGALFASLYHHRRIADDGDRAVVALLTGQGGEEHLYQELLPCPPDDELFEPRLKAVLRRHVVERCIYGVDLDPLAVELCRLALWIETMDRSLPFSFLDHKIKCGNSLVGAWFDQFQHYPVMAWKNREGGDKGHTNGVHFAKEERTKAIKAFVKERLTPDLAEALLGQLKLFSPPSATPRQVHDEALGLLERLHELPVQDAAERSRIYREELLGADAYRSLTEAMNLWCACWFWPTQELEHAPLPSNLSAPREETRALAERVAAQKRFFHWELEFPDVFRAAGSGFGAVLGNPPWDIAKPSSKEFFSNVDPLYRSYGKQEALSCQTHYFEDAETEGGWLDYFADFKAQSNFTKYTASAFGDPQENEKSQKRFAIGRGKASAELHSKWRRLRGTTRGFGDSAHPYRHQGSADLNLYKLFLEQAHALLRTDGRLGFVVPSGLYSDHGTGALRQLFLDGCQWEWLFGFENRDKVFEIDSRYKFNPIILQKGGSTAAIRTAFMRRKLEDWGQGEDYMTIYPRTRVTEFSPNALALLEIQSDRDLEILERMAGSSVALRDLSQAGELRYINDEFHLSKHSRFFPPMPKWQTLDFSPDEYGRWTHSDGRVALPMYEGRMIDQFDFSAKGWVKGKGRGAVWREVPWQGKRPEPQFLISETDATSLVYGTLPGPRVVIKDVTSATNERTVRVAVTSRFPCGHTAPLIRFTPPNLGKSLYLAAIMNSFAFDHHMRLRVGGLHATWNYLEEGRLPEVSTSTRIALICVAARLALPALCFAPEWLAIRELFPRRAWQEFWAMTFHERQRLQVIAHALSFALYGLDWNDVIWILRGCDRPSSSLSRSLSKFLDPKGFWRVDKDADPELRLTVLTLVAFRDLQQRNEGVGASDLAIMSFCTQNDGDGWALPETLRLADYGLGHDERAKHHQPVASRLGPRFNDWQLDQDSEESWRECHLHARNLLGEDGYRKLLQEIEAEKCSDDSPPTKPASSAGPANAKGQASLLFD